VQLAEVGPRFEMKREQPLSFVSFQHAKLSDYVLAYEIRQGTIEQNEAEREWVLAHYSRTAKKRKLLAGPTFASDGDEATSKKRSRR
jgi:U3 small nucleolar ribonucleoprotein protein IMP4